MHSKLPIGQPMPFYDALSHDERKLIDAGTACMCKYLRESGLAIEVTGHIDLIANEIARWFLETGTVKLKLEANKAGAPDSGHSFMQWWRVGAGANPESNTIGYHGVDTPLWD